MPMRATARGLYACRVRRTAFARLDHVPDMLRSVASYVRALLEHPRRPPLGQELAVSTSDTSSLILLATYHPRRLI